jgi:hypothetical protein
LNQDITLFDTEASTGEVIAAITSDIIDVQEALSEKVGLYITNLNWWWKIIKTPKLTAIKHATKYVKQ